MVASTERRPLRWALLTLLAIQTLGGCATSALLEASTRTERAVAYREAWTDGERLWLRYETEPVGERARLDHDARLERRVRAASLNLADVDPARGIPIDAVAVEHPRVGEIPTQRLEALSVGLTSAGEGPALVVEPGPERHAGFRLRGVPGQPENARLDSGALVERRYAWWAWPLLPFALAYDAVTAPPLTLLGQPFLLGD